jgi:hypothetical protein
MQAFVEGVPVVRLVEQILRDYLKTKKGDAVARGEEAKR